MSREPLTITRLAPGSYTSTDNRVRIERVNLEARKAGYRDGWHLFLDNEYADTFITKAEAVEQANLWYADEEVPHHPKPGDRFRHARQLDTSWEPGPGQRYADAPHAIMVVTRVAQGRVWYGLDEERPHGSWVADAAEMPHVVGEWL